MHLILSKLTSPHPQAKKQIFWNIYLLNLLIFPFLPTWGGIGISLALLATLKQDFKLLITNKFYRIVGVFLLWIILVSFFAYKPLDTWLAVANLAAHLLSFVGFSLLIQTPQQLKKIAQILLLGSIPVVILGLGQMWLGWTTPESLIPLFGWQLLPTGNPPGRMASTFMYANILAGYLIMIFSLGLGLFLHYLKGENKYIKYILAFLLILIAIAMILTNSRNAWGIMIFSIFVWAIYQQWWIIVGGVTTIFTMIMTAAFAPNSIAEIFRVIVPRFIWARLNDQMFPDRPNETLRATQWQFATQMTIEKPFTGWGLRSFSALYEQKTGFWLGHPHNLYLMLTAETGIISTLFLFAIVGFILGKAILLMLKLTGEEKLIIFSYLITFVGCMLFNTVDVTWFDFRVNTLSWMILGALLGVINNYKFTSIKS
jgi:O-antigen ligase